MNPAKLIRDNILRDGETLTLSELCNALAASTATPPCFVPDPEAVWKLCQDTPGIFTDPTTRDVVAAEGIEFTPYPGEWV